MTVNSPSNTASSSAASAAAANTSASGSTGLANEQVFLQLLVAQLQNQDPTQPADPIEFVSELAQFSSLEQEVQMRQDLDQINTDTMPPAGTAGSSSPTTATT